MATAHVGDAQGLTSQEYRRDPYDHGGPYWIPSRGEPNEPKDHY